VFEYNEELRINSKYKLYSGEQSFYVAPDTEYVFLRIADSDNFEWRKAEKDSKIAKKALELLSDIEYKYCSELKPEGWKNQVLYNPDKEGQPSYFVRIMDKDAQKLADALEGESYTQTIAVDIAKQYSIILDGRQYYVTNSIDKVILQRVNSEGTLWTEISKDSDIAKKINGILEKAVDIEPTFWCEDSH
jgi:hypothetical protein